MGARAVGASCGSGYRSIGSDSCPRERSRVLWTWRSDERTRHAPTVPKNRTIVTAKATNASMIDDWPDERREIAYIEARAVIDAQNTTMTDIDDKAMRTVRLNTVLLGLLVTGFVRTGTVPRHVPAGSVRSPHHLDSMRCRHLQRIEPVRRSAGRIHRSSRHR